MQRPKASWIAAATVTALSIVASGLGAFNEWPSWAWFVLVPLLVLSLLGTVLLPRYESTDRPQTSTTLNIGRSRGVKIGNITSDADDIVKADRVRGLTVGDIDQERKRKD